MADLVSIDEMQRFLRELSVTEKPLIQEIVDAVEALFENQCGRTDIPFQAAEVGRVEVLDGTGGPRLWLPYPIASVSAIAIGRDAADPDEELDPDDVDEVVWYAGRRKLERTDGGLFGAMRSPRMVRVTYTTQDYLPLDAAMAVKRVTAAVYRQIGSEDSKFEQVGGLYSHNLADIASGDPAWGLALQAHRRVQA